MNTNFIWQKVENIGITDIRLPDNRVRQNSSRSFTASIGVPGIVRLVMYSCRSLLRGTSRKEFSTDMRTYIQVWWIFPSRHPVTRYQLTYHHQKSKRLREDGTSWLLCNRWIQALYRKQSSWVALFWAWCGSAAQVSGRIAKSQARRWIVCTASRENLESIEGRDHARNYSRRNNHASRWLQLQM